MRFSTSKQIHWTFACLLAATLTLVLSVSATAQDAGQSWVGTWATAPVALPPSEGEAASALGPAPPRVQNQTLRQIVHTSIGGSSVRVVLTNLFGSSPLEIGAAHIALRADEATLDPQTGGPLLFDGQAEITIAPGSTVLSDPVEMQVPALGDLLIDLYLPGDASADTEGATVHPTGLTTNYLSTGGDHTGATDLPIERSFQNWFYLSRVEILAPSGTGVIVTFGDSITDGTASTADTNSRWPDFLARRLLESGNGANPVAVMNVGIGGNRVLGDNFGLGLLLRAPGDPEPPPANPNAVFGPSALSRMDRDVFLQPGVTHLIVLESINDIGMAFDSASPTVAELIEGHTALVQRAHARGLRVYGGTLTPYEGAFYFRSVGEAKRQAFNEWIRTSQVYDAVIDFDAAVRDPSNPSRFIEAYQSGDWLHPSDEGYRVMAEAIDLNLFDQ